tara:strand:- start:2496 stop:2978 length:483 start_codon:yes stop_codon:yes gene_type:complete
MLNFKTGSGNNISLEEMISICQDYISKGAKIFVGTDSYMTKSKVCFASVICLHGNGNKGKYFFHRDVVPIMHYRALVNRITEEVRRSIELSEELVQHLSTTHDKIEIHIDASPVEAKNQTSRFVDMLQGYVQGAGFSCRVKPNAWASQSVADKHSKATRF